MNRVYLIFLFFFIHAKIICKKADILIFSFDRPIQLYAFLESVEKYISNVGQIDVIYRVSNIKYQIAYEIVRKRFKEFNFIKQSKEPYKDFKKLVIQCISKNTNEYIIFGVDDIVVKDYFDISKCINVLEKTNAYGFYLRLGKNIDYCYMLGIKTPVPKYNKIDDDIYIFKFNDGLGDWKYPNSLDMVLYKKSKIINQLLKIQMIHPGNFESNWHKIADFKQSGLFFEESKIVNLPLNICNSLSKKNADFYSLDFLLNKFNENYKIDISKFYKINNNSPHMEYKLEFIKR